MGKIPLMWTHKCPVQGKISVEMGFICPWCAKKQPAIDDNPLGDEAADVSTIDGYRVGEPHPVTNT